MKIEELREIAKVRTPGEWPCWSDADIAQQITLDGLLRPVVVSSDAEFIATMANHIGALLDVAEAALDHLPYIASGDLFGAGKYSEHNISAHKLREALKKLEAVE